MIVDTINQVQQELRTHNREYERIGKLIIKEDWAIIFNESCLKEDMLPTFTTCKGCNCIIGTNFPSG